MVGMKNLGTEGEKEGEVRDGTIERMITPCIQSIFLLLRVIRGTLHTGCKVHNFVGQRLT